MAERLRRRLRVEAGCLCDNARVRLSGDAAHHARVMRLRPGALIELFDGAGASAEATLLEVDGERVIARIESLRSEAAESPLNLVLVQALPVKLPRMDTIVRQVTELGIARIVPLLAERSQLPGGGMAAVQRRLARWQAIAETAAQQSRRARVPTIDAPLRFAELDWANCPAPVWALCPGSPPPAWGGGAGQGLTVVVGPEGGLAEAEIESIPDAVRVGLGPRTLRADSAGVVIAAIAQHRWGDLGA